jgi:hypothetical protein
MPFYRSRVSVRAELVACGVKEGGCWGVEGVSAGGVGVCYSDGGDGARGTMERWVGVCKERFALRSGVVVVMNKIERERKVSTYFHKVSALSTKADN